MKVDGRSSEPFNVERGVRQGCVLSPLLFNVYGEYIIRKALDGWEGGVVIGGRRMDNLRYADDTTLIAKDEQEMSSLIQRVARVSLEFGLQLNRQKTKLMLIDRTHSMEEMPNIKDVENVEEITYLGAHISRNGGSSQEIRRRIALVKKP